MTERLKIREVEYNKILQRYANVKKELEASHRIESEKQLRAYQVLN